MGVDCVALAKSGGLKKAKVGELKEYLKKFKQPQAGEKEDLMLRVELHVKSRDIKIDGKDAFDLKPAELRKICAQRGLNPMEERDILLKNLIESELGGSGGSGSGGGGGGGDNEAERIAKKVLDLDDDYCSILSLLGENITSKSPPAAIRKQYLLLSRMIHPDKLSGFKQATKAFQLLVSAFDGLTRPDMRGADTGPVKTKTLNRSNQGCFRTQITCPRCHAPWGEAVDGLEPAAYTHMMTGIKTYCCSTCLLEFGCMSAEHRCPHCRKGFEYSPDAFHQKILCGNKGCNREFGFMLYVVSEARTRELREELKAVQEKRLRRQEALDGRNARAKAKGLGADLGEAEALKEEVAAFRQGLLDCCPQCGWDMGRREGAEEACKHLEECRDAKKIAGHQRRRAVEKGKKAEKERRAGAQAEVTNLKTWEFLGATNESMWMLSLPQLQAQCKQYKLDDEGDKEQLIRRLVRHRNSLDASRLLTDGGGGGGGGEDKVKMPTQHSLPSGLESMSLAQLRAVAAAHGIKATGGSKESVLAAIEGERFRDEPQLRLTMTAEHEAEEEIKVGKRRAAKRGKKALDDSDEEETPQTKPGKRSKTAKAEEGDDDDDDDDEFVPDE